eukprot:gene7724-10497_t
MSADEPLVPDELICSDQVFDVCFHPKTNVLSLGLISGAVQLYRYERPQNISSSHPPSHLFTNYSHLSSCRGVLFSENGEVLYTISSDKTIQGLDGQGKQVLFYSNAHADPINKLINISEQQIATGDDSGEVKLWDIRVPNEAVMTWHSQEDFISGLVYNDDKHSLISVSGDATLCAFDLRNHNNINRSDEQESEIHCVTIIKDGKKILCGTQDGVVLVFTWDRWGDCSDRFPGHPQSVDCIWKIDESTIITGSSDGLIRVLSIQPNKVLGIIGDHEDFPVEGLSVSCDRNILATIHIKTKTERFYADL